MIRICLFGGRDLPQDRSFDCWCALSRILETRGKFELVNGMCPSGADLFAREWAEATGRPIDEFHADWQRFGLAAGPIRNRAMAISGLAGAVSFPGGKGTAVMAAECAAAGVAVWAWS